MFIRFFFSLKKCVKLYYLPPSSKGESVFKKISNKFLLSTFVTFSEVSWDCYTLRFSLAQKYLAITTKRIFRLPRVISKHLLYPPSIGRRIEDRDLLLLSAIKGYSTMAETKPTSKPTWRRLWQRQLSGPHIQFQCKKKQFVWTNLFSTMHYPEHIASKLFFFF